MDTTAMKGLILITANNKCVACASDDTAEW